MTNDGGLTIRRMALSDIDQVHALELATFAIPWSREAFINEIEKNPAARYLVGVEGDAVVAYGGAWLIFEEGHITNIAVRADRRGLGYGKAITKALLQYAANLGVQYMTLEVRRSNHVAQNLYKAMGFEAVGYRKRYYEDNGEDALLMVCQQMPAIEMDFEEPETVKE